MFPNVCHLGKANENALANVQAKFEADLQTIKESQSQSFKNHHLKILNEMKTMKEEQNVKMSHLESFMDELESKINANLGKLLEEIVSDDL